MVGVWNFDNPHDGWHELHPVKLPGKSMAAALLV